MDWRSDLLNALLMALFGIALIGGALVLVMGTIFPILGMLASKFRFGGER